jgi:hypothetical protein
MLAVFEAIPGTALFRLSSFEVTTMKKLTQTIN